MLLTHSLQGVCSEDMNCILKKKTNVLVSGLMGSSQDQMLHHCKSSDSAGQQGHYVAYLQ